MERIQNAVIVVVNFDGGATKKDYKKHKNVPWIIRRPFLIFTQKTMNCGLGTQIIDQFIIRTPGTVTPVRRGIRPFRRPSGLRQKLHEIRLHIALDNMW